MVRLCVNGEEGYLKIIHKTENKGGKQEKIIIELVKHFNLNWNSSYEKNAAFFIQSVILISQTELVKHFNNFWTVLMKHFGIFFY